MAKTAHRRRDRNQSGAAAVEFALGAPLLALMLVGIVEIGFATRRQMQVEDAAAAGALYASANGWDQAGIATAVTSAKSNAAISASPAPSQFCGCPTAAGITTDVCGHTCADGAASRSYVLVSAQVTRISFLSSALALPVTLTATATTRIP